jgi:DNA-binding HxlR family transcriptional regulator
MQYGQFCPIAKATEILGERWTILILREVLMGGRRFSELQRGLGEISPALLTRRLKSLEEQGIVARRRISGQRSYEYYPTAACDALLPIILSIGKWGLRWARHLMVAKDFDVDFLMLYLERSIDPSHMPGDQTVIHFNFTDLPGNQDWWLLVYGETVELCVSSPRRDVDVYFTTTVRTMHDVWMGDRTYRDAMRCGDLIIEGELALTRNVTSWLRPAVLHEAPRAPIPQVAAVG